MIIIDIINVRWEPGKSFYKTVKERNEFEAWIAGEYIRLIKAAVADQRFKAKWAPLSVPYLEFKKANGLSEKIWEATGELISRVVYKSTQVIGFDGRRRHAGSKAPYKLIARTLEYGNLNIPSRPLFRPVYMYMRKNIKFFKKNYEAL